MSDIIVKHFSAWVDGETEFVYSSFIYNYYITFISVVSKRLILMSVNILLELDIPLEYRGMIQALHFIFANGHASQSRKHASPIR